MRVITKLSLIASLALLTHGKHHGYFKPSVHMKPNNHIDDREVYNGDPHPIGRTEARIASDKKLYEEFEAQRAADQKTLHEKFG